MNERREKGDPGHICSKGVTRCFQSVKRVKILSKKYLEETYKKKSLRHTASNESITVDGEPKLDNHKSPSK
jgi:hypothetical protein